RNAARRGSTVAVEPAEVAQEQVRDLAEVASIAHAAQSEARLPIGIVALAVVGRVVGVVLVAMAVDLAIIAALPPSLAGGAFLVVEAVILAVSAVAVTHGH